MTLEDCIDAIDEMLMRLERLSDAVRESPPIWVQGAEISHSPEPSVTGDEIHALNVICLDVLKRHLPRDSEIIKNWYVPAADELRLIRADIADLSKKKAILQVLAKKSKRPAE